MGSKISLLETALLPFVTFFRMIVVHKLLLIINFYLSWQVTKLMLGEMECAVGRCSVCKDKQKK